jgi:hypothetical protein
MVEEAQKTNYFCYFRIDPFLGIYCAASKICYEHSIRIPSFLIDSLQSCAWSTIVSWIFQKPHGDINKEQDDRRMHTCGTEEADVARGTDEKMEQFPF